MFVESVLWLWALVPAMLAHIPARLCLCDATPEHELARRHWSRFFRGHTALAAWDGRALPEPQPMGLIGDVVAGIETQFCNVAAVVESAGDLEHWTLAVKPFRATNALEKYLKVPASTRSTLRQTVAPGPFFRRRDLDVVWTQVWLPLLPWVTSSRVRDLPLFVYATDCTPKLLRDFEATTATGAVALG